MHVARISLFCVAALVALNARSLAVDRPEWMDQPGIVMAGSWEEPSFRARRMGRTDYTLPPEKQAEYAREHSPEMIAQLKDLGVNFLMIHCYKGAGMKTEHDGMEDARRFAQLGPSSRACAWGRTSAARCSTSGSSTRSRMPRSGRLSRRSGEPIPYGDQTFRHLAVRNHPGFIEYLKKPIRFAIEDVHADLIHFDNFGCGAASYDPFSKQQFRQYLRSRAMTPSDPPSSDEPNSSPLVRAWKDYKCQALTDHYAAMSKYIRSLNPQCAVECNPSAAGGGALATVGIDPTRLLPWGNAFWDEGWGAAWSEKDGVAQTRIRTLKVGELYNNSAFVYCENALDLAESMAFNVNCLGCVAWFEWGKLIAAHQQSDTPPSKELKPYIRFFLDHQDLYRHWPSVADVAVLRTFAEQSFGPQKYQAVEQALIQGHVAWRMIFDQQLDQLAGYRVLVIPDDEWLTTTQREQIDRFAEQGGRVVRSADIRRPMPFRKPCVLCCGPWWMRRDRWLWSFANRAGRHGCCCTWSTTK